LLFSASRRLCGEYPFCGKGLGWTASQGYDFKDSIWAAWAGDFADASQDLTEKGIDYLIEKFAEPENVVAPI